MTHSREFVVKIYDTYEETQNKRETGRRLGVNEGTVRHWLSNPARFDPYIDWVAVERALLGERKVFKALTIWEEREVYSRLTDILSTPGLNEKELSDIYQMYVTAWGVPLETIQKRVERVRCGIGAAA